jgi:hypothetical protein
MSNKLIIKIIFCVGVVYSGEYDVCDVTLSVYPHRASLKNMPGHGGNRTYLARCGISPGVDIHSE